MLRRLRRQDGAVMIEAVIGMVMILYITLLVVQIVLVFHGTLAARSAAARVARAVALDDSHRIAVGRDVYEAQKGVSLASLQWRPVQCQNLGNAVSCTVVVAAPTVLPAGALFFGGGLRGPIEIEAVGRYPIITQ